MTNTTKKDDFPRFGTPEEQLRFLLQYAILAPSSHNTQPWLWEIAVNEVTLRADRTRLMPALDPLGRELIMSCGAALQHLCLAMQTFGFAALVQTFPDVGDVNLLAHIRMVLSRPATQDEKVLFRFIPKRHTPGTVRGEDITFRADADHAGGRCPRGGYAALNPQSRSA